MRLPSSASTIEAILEKQPLACRGVLPGRPRPVVISKDWFVHCIKQKTVADMTRFTLPSSPRADDTARPREPLARIDPERPANTSPRDVASDSSRQRCLMGDHHRSLAFCSKRATTAATLSHPGSDDRGLIDDALCRHERAYASKAAKECSKTPCLGVGSRASCVADEIALARESLAKYATAPIVCRRDFETFAAQGYPGFIGRTNVVVDIVLDELDGTWSRRDAARRESAVERRRGNGVRGRSLLELPDGVLIRCLEQLPMLDLLAAAASCRRLGNLALGAPLDAHKTPTRGGTSRAWSGRDLNGGVWGVRALRIMTWNLKDNDPNPLKRFANQPGAGEERGGWHWYSRVPVVARVVQREVRQRDADEFVLTLKIHSALKVSCYFHFRRIGFRPSTSLWPRFRLAATTRHRRCCACKRTLRGWCGSCSRRGRWATQTPLNTPVFLRLGIVWNAGNRRERRQSPRQVPPVSAASVSCLAATMTPPTRSRASPGQRPSMSWQRSRRDGEHQGSA